MGSLFDKVAGLQAPIQVFSCENAKFLGTTFLTEHLRWLLFILPTKDGYAYINF